MGVIDTVDIVEAANKSPHVTFFCMKFYEKIRSSAGNYCFGGSVSLLRIYCRSVFERVIKGAALLQVPQ